MRQAIPESYARQSLGPIQQATPERNAETCPTRPNTVCPNEQFLGETRKHGEIFANVPQRSQRTAFRQDFTEMYSRTAYFGEMVVFCTLRTEKTLSEGTFREYLAKNVEVFCPRVQNTPIYSRPRRRRRRIMHDEATGNRIFPPRRRRRRLLHFPRSDLRSPRGKGRRRIGGARKPFATTPARGKERGGQAALLPSLPSRGKQCLDRQEPESSILIDWGPRSGTLID